MKSVTATLSNYLNNTKNITSCDLYELQLSNGNTYYYCDTDIDVTYNGNIYKHNALLLERQNTKLNDRVVVDTMTVRISANSKDTIEGKPVLLAAHDGSFDLAKLYLRRCFFTGTTVQGVIDLFAGNVEVKKCGGIGLELTIKAKTQGLSQEFPTRKFYPQGTFTTTNGTIKENGENDNYCVITPFVPLKEVLL